MAGQTTHAGGRSTAAQRARCRGSDHSSKLAPLRPCTLVCMSSLRIAAVIPARLGSTRMARKVLRPIAGRPMVEWVWRAASASGLMDPVVVATDAG